MKINIQKGFYYEGRIYPLSKGVGEPCYAASIDIDGETFEYVRIYQEKYHTAELDKSFEEDALKALEILNRRGYRQ